MATKQIYKTDLTSNKMFLYSVLLQLVYPLDMLMLTFMFKSSFDIAV